MTGQLSPSADLSGPPGTSAPSASIGLDDVVGVGNVDEALAGFYDRQTGDVAEQTGVSERRIRGWIEENLISEQGFRTQSLAGTGVAEEVLGMLEDARLVRTESRRGTVWYELSHDRLVAPVRESNAEWRAQHLSPLQYKAQEWIEHDRSEGLLIGGDVLVAADEWAAEHPQQLLDTEQEYLDRCHEREQAALALKRSSRRNRILAIVAFAFAALAVAGLIWAWQARSDAANERDNAQDSARRAQAAALAARSRELASEDPALALAVAAESTKLTQLPEPETVRAVVGGRVAVVAQSSPVGEKKSFDDGVDGASVSPDGRLVAVAEGSTLQVFDRESGDELAVAVGQGPILDSAFSADGSWAATAGSNGEIMLWEPGESSMELVDVLEQEPADLIHTVAFSPDSTMLASGDDEGRAWLWDLTVSPPEPTVLDRRPIDGDVELPPGDVFDVAFRADGKVLASAEGDRNQVSRDRTDNDRNGQVVVWDVASGQAIKRLLAPVAKVSEPPGDPDAPRDDSAANEVAFHPDRDLLVSGHANGRIWSWWGPTHDDSLAFEVDAHARAIRGLVFDGAGGVLASSSADHTIRMWATPPPDDIESWAPIGAPLTQHEDWVSGLAVAPTPDGGEEFVSSSRDGTVRRWTVPEVPSDESVEFDNSVRTGVVHSPCDVAEDPADCFATAVAFSADGVLLASTGFDGVIRLWDPRTGKRVGEGTPDPADLVDDDEQLRMYSVAFSPQEQLLVAGGHGRVWLAAEADGWNVVSLDYQPDESASEGASDLLPIRGVAVDPAGTRAVTAGEDGVVRLFDLDTGAEVDAVPIEDVSLDAVAIGADGLIAVGASDGGVRTLTIESGGLKLSDDVLGGEDVGDDVRGVALAGGVLASAGKDFRIRLWNPSDSGAEPKVLRGHRDQVGTVAFDEDQMLLASASDDGTIRLWPLAPDLLAPTGRPIVGEPLPALSACSPECFVLGVAFGKDDEGVMLASAGTDGYVSLWKQPWDPDTACEVAGQYLDPPSSADGSAQNKLELELGSLELQVCR